MLSLLVMASLGVVWLWWPQPTYEGRTLREWLDQPAHPSELEARIAQGEAIRHFGAAAIPELLAELQGKTWHARLWKFDDWLDQKSDGQLRVMGEDYFQGLCPADAFAVLGELAEPAVPKLLELVQAPDDDLGQAAANALVGIGTSNAWHALLSLLSATNPTISCRAVVSDSRFSWHPPHDLEPVLTALATNRTPGVARAALDHLACVSDNTALIVRLLTNGLASPDSRTRMVTVEGLQYQGRAAASAVPALHNLLQPPMRTSMVAPAVATTLRWIQFETHRGAIIRGPQLRPQIALLFTGHEYAEGANTILASLAKHHAHASFFLTGSFLTNSAFSPLVHRIAADGHYLGIHSDQHLLYCSWDARPKTLVNNWQFYVDAMRNLERLGRIRLKRSAKPPDGFYGCYFVPPFEHWNHDIANWARKLGMRLISFTPGTRANADYTEDGASNFVSSQAIFDSILAREREDPNGLNGFLVLMHLGAGPKRTDKFHDRLDELLTVLSAKGYQFVRVDTLLAPEEP